jgi:hypothetical protein
MDRADWPSAVTNNGQSVQHALVPSGLSERRREHGEVVTGRVEQMRERHALARRLAASADDLPGVPGPAAGSARDEDGAHARDVRRGPHGFNVGEGHRAGSDRDAAVVDLVDE